MTDKNTDLRKKAEEKAARLHENIEAMSPEEVRRTLHELHVHQIELTIQNEELRRAQVELDAARARYFDLYDLAPVGYCTISEQGIVLEANLAAANLLDVARGVLIKQPLSRYILPEDAGIYYLHRKQLFEPQATSSLRPKSEQAGQIGEPQACELRMVKNDRTAFWARLEAIAAQGDDGAPICRLVMSDISMHKFQEDEHELTARLIALVNTPGDFRERMSAMTASLQGWSGCEAVGIRLRAGDDFPYYETCGFPTAFVREENQLCAYGSDGKILRDGTGNPMLECMCGNILCGRFDSSKPFFTTHGSFWSNNTTALLASTTEADRQARTRNRCNGEGYESVALVPLRSGQQAFGLLQFNDHRPDRFTPDLIVHFERLADSLAIALSRRQAEEALRESETSLREAQEIARMGRWELDLTTNHLVWSDGIFVLFEVNRDTFAASHEAFMDIVHPDDRELLNQVYRDAVENKAPYELEHRLLMKDGRIKWVSEIGRTEYDDKGNPIRTIGTVQDINERKLLEEVQVFLAQTSSGTQDEPFFEVLAQYLAQNLGMDFVCIDRLEGDGLTARTVAVWCDGNFEDNVTYALKDTPCGDVVGKMVCCFPASVCQFFPKDQVLKDLRAESYVGVTLFDHTGRPIGLIAVIGRSPLKNRPLAEATLKMVAVRAAGEMERLDAETALRDSEEAYRTLFREMLDGFALHEIICDEQGRPDNYRFLAVNPAFERMTGLNTADIVGRTVLEAIPGIERHWIDTYGKVALTGEPAFFENYAAELKKHFEVTAYRPAPNQFACIFADITERKRSEEEKANLEVQIQQAQKMESVGRLAGGVAHDFNNKLGVILGYTEMALDQVEPTLPLHADLEQIRTAANHAADLTRQLLAFARKQTVAPKVLDLNRTVTSMLKMLQRLIGENIHINWRPDANLWPVKVDPSQIDQILTNLCINARDAISDVGKMTIETGKCSFDEDYCAAYTGFLPGEYVLLAVSDNGCGMDTETMSHLFEPFYTTKDVGKGTGLGLATVYGIVRQNNGIINVYSEPDKGTTFRIYLPRHVGKTGHVQIRGPEEVDSRGHEAILLVEDDPSILEMTTRMLEKQGYTVLSASTPGAAIRLALERAGEINLLMTDVVMPEMNGRDLAKNLLSLYPHLKRLFMSGYTADVIAHHGVLDEGVYFIQKPFSIKELAAKVREALDQE